jgi:pimeloyl-ACP methyl ester carboxylesterase
MPYAQAGEVRLYYEEHGRGAPLVLAPGFGAGLWIWYRQIPALAERFRVIAFDPRGVARSAAAPDGELSTRLLADDLAALLDALGVRDAHVLGGSFGGFVAQEFALAHAGRVRGLILCCTSYGGPGHLPPRPETLEAIASTRGLNTEDRVRQNLLLAFSPRFVAEEAEEVGRVIALRAENPVPEQVYLRQLRAAVGFDARARVGSVRAPTLVITGDEDRIVPHENSLNLAALIPGARLRVVAGGSHAFFIEQADEFNRAVAEFIESVEGRPPQAQT